VVAEAPLTTPKRPVLQSSSSGGGGGGGGIGVGLHFFLRFFEEVSLALLLST